jgi:hypothetical protein
MKALLFVCLTLAIPLGTAAQELRTEHVFLITLDGLRWQELFTGADTMLLRDERFTRDRDRIAAQFGSGDAMERRRRLMPFFWEVVVREGQVYGNRALGSRVDLTNPHRFSYPGSSELLTGHADERIDSNARRPNPNVTVLEFVNGREPLHGKVAAFGSWDVFPFIINEERSGVPVNAGFMAAVGEDLSDRQLFLNELQEQIPSPWSSVRLDAFTHHYALEYLKTHRPRLLYIAYGETDDFAHDGRYDAYLASAHRTDAFIRMLWEAVQADPHYAGRTTFVITTDHGRGDGDDWTRHGRDIEGAQHVWLAAIGPDTPPRGEVAGGAPLFLNQVARTVAALLGLDFDEERAGAPIGSILGR